MNWLAVFIGGGLGSVARFGLGQIFKNFSASWPWATLLSNVLASAILAATILWVSTKSEFHNSWFYVLLTVGFCGGFSTFSTFSLETFQLLKAGHVLPAVLNIVVSVSVCVLLIWILLRKVQVG